MRTKTSQRPRVWKCKPAAVRRASGLSLRDLGEATGLSNVTISFAERGFGISLETAVRLVRFFCVPVEELWVGLEDDK